MANILIKNGKVWDGEGFYYADVLTDKKTILKIAENITDTAEFTFDARGKIVSAGLVDAHIHIKGISSDAFGINAEMACLPFGVTAAADASGVKGDKAFLNKTAIKSRTFVVADFKDNKADFTNTVKMLKKYGEKVTGIKVYYDTVVSDIVDAEPLKEVVAFAEKNNLIIMVHSSNSPISMIEMVSILRKGDILTHSYHGGKNNTSEHDYQSIMDAKQRGVMVDAGFAGYVHTDFKVFSDAVKCGAKPDIISTDITRSSAYKRGGRYGLTMCMSIAKTLGMNEEEIFKCVTSTPAKALGIMDDCGVLKVGRKADIAVLEYTDEGFDMTDKSGNRVYDRNGYRCVLTVLDGDVLYRR